MTEEQLDKLLAYIDARLDEKIEEAFGRDSLYETIAKSEALDELRKSLT